MKWADEQLHFLIEIKKINDYTLCIEFVHSQDLTRLNCMRFTDQSSNNWLFFHVQALNARNNASFISDFWFWNLANEKKSTTERSDCNLVFSMTILIRIFLHYRSFQRQQLSHLSSWWTMSSAFTQILKLHSMLMILKWLLMISKLLRRIRCQVSCIRRKKLYQVFSSFLRIKRIKKRHATCKIQLFDLTLLCF